MDILESYLVRNIILKNLNNIILWFIKLDSEFI